MWLENYFGKPFYVMGEEKIEKRIGEIISSPHFNDVVFNEKQKEFMELVLTKLKKDRLNLLFSGPAGTGKTYTSKMIACETGKPFIYLNGAMSKNRIIKLMLNAKDNAIILIDEIHNLPEKVAEIIYSAIQDNEIYESGICHKIENITFIGTTTEPEQLPKPLQDRFMRIEFEEPDVEMAKKILKKMRLKDDEIKIMLNYTHNIRIIKKIISYMEMYSDERSLMKVFRMMRINCYSGLSDEQDNYINYLKNNKKASLRNLSFFLRRSENYIKNDIEPDLIRKQMIMISSRGRELNPELRDYSYDELQKESEKEHSEKTMDEIELAHQYLKDNPQIKEKFGKKYMELVQFIADKIIEGIEPDLIDWESFGTDISVKESFDNNYLEIL